MRLLGSYATTAQRRAVAGQTADLPLVLPTGFVRGEGVWLFDAAGRRYLDAQHQVAHVGHGNPRVADAVRQESLLPHSTGAHECAVEYASQLGATFDNPLAAVQFCSSGSQAFNLALRMSQRHSNSSGVIVGSMGLRGLASFDAAVDAGAGPLPDWVRAIAFPDEASALGSSNWELTCQFLDRMAAAISSLQASGYGVAALLLDPLFTAEGLPSIPNDALEAAITMVRDAGGLYIAVEGRSGLGRTGGHFWGYQQYASVPDLVTLAESAANGMSLGAVVMADELLEALAFAEPALGVSYDPLAIAAAQATLLTLEADALCQRATVVGEYLRYRIGELAEEFPVLGQVRGAGHFLVVDVLAEPIAMRGAEVTVQRSAATGVTARHISSELNRRGILLDCAGPDGSRLQLSPPMTFALEHADLLLEQLGEVLRQ